MSRKKTLLPLTKRHTHRQALALVLRARYSARSQKARAANERGNSPIGRPSPFQRSNPRARGARVQRGKKRALGGHRLARVGSQERRRIGSKGRIGIGARGREPLRARREAWFFPPSDAVIGEGAAAGGRPQPG